MHYRTVAGLWLVDKLLIYLVARSYVDDVADVFDLDKHLAKAVALAVFVIAVYLIGKAFSRSRTSRRIGYLGIVGLLIAHSLLPGEAPTNQKFTTSGESIKCYVITHEGKVRYGERPGIDPADWPPLPPGNTRTRVYEHARLPGSEPAAAERTLTADDFENAVLEGAIKDIEWLENKYSHSEFVKDALANARWTIAARLTPAKLSRRHAINNSPHREL